MESATNPIETKIEEKHLESRSIYLWGAVTDESAKYIVDRLLYLNSLDKDKPINLYINSPGGVITSGMAIIDTMHMITNPVSTIVMGLAASMGALILCVGEKGMRGAFKHSRIMIHQPLISGQIVAPALDLKIHAEEIKKTRQELNRMIADASGKSLEEIERDTDRDHYLTADDALSYGLIDKIL
jgi:ATP-dependent Clp protease, protease subunit